MAKRTENTSNFDALKTCLIPGKPQLFDDTGNETDVVKVTMINQANGSFLPVEHEPLKSKIIEERSESESEDYDTDFEESIDLTDERFQPEKKKPQDCSEIYRVACRKFGVVPTSIFLRFCTTSSIDLNHYGIGDKGARAVAMAMKCNKTITCLNLHDNNIQETGIKDICEMVSFNNSLTKLDLSGNHVGVKGISALSKMIQRNGSLKNLNLSCCGIHPGIHDGEDFISSLVYNHHLETLCLSYNEIGGKGAASLESVLFYNRSLRVLDVSWNNIRPLDAACLCAGLGKNKTLTELDLSWNGLGDRGSEYMKQALIQNKSLRILDLRNNHITVNGIKSIAQSLQRNTTLQVLKVGRNPFLSFGASVLLKSLQLNEQSSLCKLILDDVPFNKECEEDLATLTDINPLFLCKWDGSIKGGAVSKRQPELLDRLLASIHEKGFRLIDFYRVLMNDNDYDPITGLKKEEFVSGVKKRNLPFSSNELRKIFDLLDPKESGSIKYEQFLAIKSGANQKAKTTLG